MTISFSDPGILGAMIEPSGLNTRRTTVKATYKGQDRSGKFRYIDTWVRRSGVWQCVASAGAKITAQ